MANVVRFIKTFESRLVVDENKVITNLLWGDQVRLTGQTKGDLEQGYARGVRKPGWVKAAHLSPTSDLLEVYVIDVGQGDAVLFRTPDQRWHLVDGGKQAAKQMTRKGVINFLRWKFLDDLGEDAIKLASVILSHPDEDHYDGLLDLCSGTAPLRPGTIPVEIGTFYHSGVGDYPPDDLFAAVKDGTATGAGNGISAKAKFLTSFLDGADTLQSPPIPFSTTFSALVKLVLSKGTPAKRLDHGVGHLPGYAPSATGASIAVLGPYIETLVGGGVGLRYLDDAKAKEKSAGKTKNGHSVVLRIDYGKVRVLLTGDLNVESQPVLLHYVGAPAFLVDVAKACHHGSDTIYAGFIAAMAARVTVMSSGDNETYAHPRPALLGLSGKMGRMSADDRGVEVPPLLYSTEVARSVELAYVNQVRVNDPDVGDKVPPAKTYVFVPPWQEYTEKRRPLSRVPVAANLGYGLVNIRTDGKHLLCATMKESGKQFDVRVIKL